MKKYSMHVGFGNGVEADEDPEGEWINLKELKEDLRRALATIEKTNIQSEEGKALLDGGLLAFSIILHQLKTK